MKRNNDNALTAPLLAMMVVLAAATALVWLVQQADGGGWQKVAEFGKLFAKSEPEPPPADLVRRAEAGDAEAQYQAGGHYMRQNRWDLAVPWYEKAAAQGHSKAQNNLGVAYSEGRGVAVDKEKACRLFEQAHKQLNSRDSLENVALCNDQTGKTQNAFESYLSAAEQGSPSAMRLVGQMYDSGEGTAQSYEWAVYWYRQAVLRNDAQAMYLLASKYAQYQGVPKREPANAVSAYLLLKSIKMYQKPEDAQALAGLGIDERIRAFEQIMPPQMRAKLPGLEAAIRRDGTKGLLEGIDGAIPYQAPQTRP